MRAALQALATSLAALVIFFGLLEGVLALAGVQPALRSADPFVGFVSRTPLFVEEADAQGRAILTTADSKRVFFNRQTFAREKAPGSYRIFCVGGSTTYGRPYGEATSFCGWLRELLPAADPRRHWEVINAGGISYASYRVARLMEELAGYEPDLFVIYSGHNEFLEERTYGALRDRPAALATAAALLARTRTWTATSSALRRLGALPDAAPQGRAQLPAEVDALLDRSVGPERYARDDALRDQILLHYRVSLARMADIARAAGADPIFVTPASNLEDCTPFKSQHSDGLGEAQRARVQALLAIARERIGASAWAETLRALDEALALDPRFAELHYRRGQALIGLGRYDEAEAALRRARDEDVCPLRALSPMRETLAEVAAEKNARLIDFAGLVERRALSEQGHPIPGDESFLDHVHLTVGANRALALALVDALIDEGVVQPAREWGEAAIAAVSARVEGGLDHQAHAQALANLARVLVWAGKVEDASRLASQALERDPELATRDADILAIIAGRRGDAEQTWQHLRRALHARPESGQIHLQIGLEYLDTSRPGWSLEAAAGHLLLASAFMPGNDLAHQVFGLVMAERGRYALAYPSLAEALRLNPRNAEAEQALGRLRDLLGPEAQPTPAKLTLERYPSGAPRQLVQVRPDATGHHVPEGILTAWHENGELERFLDYVRGVPHGVEIRWNDNAEVVSRTEYRNGARWRSPSPAGE